MKHSQKSTFLQGEADAYFARNQSVLVQDENIAAHDPVFPVLKTIHPFPERVLEIGCSNGWRLHRMRSLGARECYGIDPSRAAIEQGGGAYPGLRLAVGTADALPFEDNACDLVVFGFCLYLCDPGDHFRIVAEADRVLSEGGHLIIFDFDPPIAYRNPYTHQPGLFSYKMDFTQLFLAHPHYQLREKRVEAHGNSGAVMPDNRVAVSWLTKSTVACWPLNPWRQ